MTIQAQIVGWGRYLPSRVLTNQDLAAMVDTSDEWIRQRTGIMERRIAAPNETTAEMSLRAAQDALRMAGISSEDIDLIIVATSTPDQEFPATACILQDALGATHAGAFDLSAGCSGFVYALAMAGAAISAGTTRLALVVGAEKLSRIIDWSDRATCVLFGDGAGAVVLRGGEGPTGILSTTLGADGSGADLLALRPKESDDPNGRGPYITMDGRRVFKFATRVMASAVNRVVSEAGLSMADLQLIIPHQANQRIIDAACEEMGFPAEKTFSNLEYYGNTSAASIPIALCEVVEEGRLADGDLVALVAFGAGLSWAAALIRWGRVERVVWYKAFRARIVRWWATARWRMRRLARRIEIRLRRLLRRRTNRDAQDESAN